MIAFEVYVNGQKVCTAAQPDQGTLHAGLTRHKLMAKRSPEADENDRVLKEGMFLSVSGIRDGAASNEHTNWIHQPVAISDEVTIKVIETETPDEPASFEPVTGSFPKGFFQQRYAEWKKNHPG